MHPTDMEKLEHPFGVVLFEQFLVFFLFGLQLQR